MDRTFDNSSGTIVPVSSVSRLLSTGIFVSHDDGEILYADEMFQTLVGAETGAELIGTAVTELVTERCREPLRSQIERIEASDTGGCKFVKIFHPTSGRNSFISYSHQYESPALGHGSAVRRSASRGNRLSGVRQTRTVTRSRDESILGGSVHRIQPIDLFFRRHKRNPVGYRPLRYGRHPHDRTRKRHSKTWLTRRL